MERNCQKLKLGMRNKLSSASGCVRWVFLGILQFLPPPPPPPKKNVNVESAIFPENYAEMDPQIIDSDSESSEQEKPVKIVEEELSDEPCQVCGRKDNLELVTTF